MSTVVRLIPSGGIPEELSRCVFRGQLNALRVSQPQHQSLPKEVVRERHGNLVRSRLRTQAPAGIPRCLSFPSDRQSSAPRPGPRESSEISDKFQYLNRRQFLSMVVCGWTRRCNPLTLMVVGLYGEVLPAPDGAPLRLAVPWKYGFKHRHGRGVCHSTALMLTYHSRA